MGLSMDPESGLLIYPLVNRQEPILLAHINKKEEVKGPNQGPILGTFDSLWIGGCCWIPIPTLLPRLAADPARDFGGILRGHLRDAGLPKSCYQQGPNDA